MISPKRFKMHRSSSIIVAVTLVVLVSLLATPVFSVSSNPCSSCHGGCSQTLAITESQINSTITVGQTITVSASLKNTVNVNKASYSTLSSVSASLRSQNGRFSVSVPTVSAASISAGASRTVTWQITAISAGTDSAIFSGSAKNTHQQLSFADSSTTSFTIVSPTTTPTPVSTPSPTPTPNLTPTPTSVPTPTPFLIPTSTPLLTPTPTSTSSPTPTLLLLR